MKRKVTRYCLLAVLLFLLAGCAQKLPSYDIAGTGYIISEFTGECVGTTDFLLKGSIFLDRADEMDFDGFMQVNAYPVSEERLKESSYFVKQENGYTYISYGGGGHKIENETLRPDISGYAYWFCIKESDPNDTIVYVTSWDNINERYYIVPAASEEGAADKLNKYLKSVYGEDYPDIA